MLPPLPNIVLSVVEDREETSDPHAFLRVRRLMLRARLDDGSASEPFAYFCADRTRMDAVVIAAHFQEGGRRMVYLRSALRPPLLLRTERIRPLPEKPTLGALWELPAGLVEEDERSPEGLRKCAA